ncbi:MAG: hypothetical protein GYA12_06470 [Chloroflexi bacterium]|nr:hypothetical protein [Chloroflexota bacterium]
MKVRNNSLPEPVEGTELFWRGLIKNNPKLAILNLCVDVLPSPFTWLT